MQIRTFELVLTEQHTSPGSSERLLKLNVISAVIVLLFYILDFWVFYADS